MAAPKRDKSAMATSIKTRKMWFNGGRFLLKPWRFGYDEPEVDEFMDKVANTLAYYEDLVWQIKNKHPHIKLPLFQDWEASRATNVSDA